MRKRVLLVILMGLLMGSCIAQASDTDQETVRAVQEALNQSGFDCGNPDGLFGAKTEEAIRRYQESNGLSVDGTISEEVLSSMGLSDPSEQPQGSSSGGRDINNEQAWDQLYQFLSENGTDIDGMKGIKKIGEDNTTYIAIVEGDDDNIYLTTKSTNGRLTFILKKNESNADFCYNELFGGKAELNGTDYIIVETDEIYSAEHATGHVDISTITSQTLLSPDTFEQEVKDVNGNIKTSTDMSQYFPDSMPKSQLYELLTGLPDVLSVAGLDITMNDLGFYTNLDKVYGIELGEHEKPLNIVNDVYTVIPDDWPVSDSKDGAGFLMYPPENTSKDNTDVIKIGILKLPNAGLRDIPKGEARESVLDSSVSSFRKDNFIMTDEQTGIEIGGFQARSAHAIETTSGGEADWLIGSFLIDGDRFEDYCIRFYYRADSSVDLKHNNEYQRMLDTIYVDTDGSYTNTLTGEEGSVDENKSWLMRYSEEQESSNETEKVKEESLTPAGTDSKTVTSDNEEEPESNTVMRLEDVLNASQETEAEVETLEISNDEYAIRYLGYDYVPDNFYGIGIGGDATKTISVNFEYTNKTDEDRNVQDDFLITVEQNGEKLSYPSAWNAEVDTTAFLNLLNGTAKNETIPVSYIAVVNDYSPLTITVSETNDDNETTKILEQEVEPPTADIVSDNEEETDSDNEIVFEEPITVMDNENVKVDFTGKYLEYDSHKQPDEIGYKVTVENKTDSYLMMNSMYASIDGFMLDIQAGPYTSFLAISPNSKANGELYIPLDGRTIGVDLNSLEDLKNFTATFQLALSKDGSSYSSDNMVDVPYSCTVP